MAVSLLWLSHGCSLNIVYMFAMEDVNTTIDETFLDFSVSILAEDKDDGICYCAVMSA